MFSFKFYLLLVSLSQIFSHTSEADTNFLFHFCSNGTNFTTNSTYKANLGRLFTSLANASSGNDTNGFYNTTAGRNPDTAYGLFLCRGDVPTRVCQNCVSQAIDAIAQRCPTQAGAVIWYEECMLRYSNGSMFSTMADRPRQVLLINQAVPEQDRFNRIVGDAVRDIQNRAATAPIGAKKFATKEANFTEFQRVCSLAQCTPDISSADCYLCLEKANADLAQYCSGKQAGFSMSPSCIVIYNVFPFIYQTEGTAPVSTPPPGPPLYPPALGRSGGRENQSQTSSLINIIIPIVIGCLFVCSALLYSILRWKAKKRPNALKGQRVRSKTVSTQSLQLDLDTIKDATNNFLDANKIGTGGFGSVYKGAFPNGEEIAVKRLSGNSGQGADEFKIEVVLLAKLQHRNLVRLLGFCTEGKERMLIYEFLPNKSLDHFLFDPKKQGQLDWPKRYQIMKGIARGLLYLHVDSRLKIIHRDLKASNILLDKDMNPKISDFGMARIIGEAQSQEPTKRIVGTYGYISPEFAMQGKFSEKSDVFSFGVLLLEIVCGKMNTSFYNSEHAENLLTIAWKRWKDGRIVELMDRSLRDSYVSNEVIRCIQIGLLCVQENPSVRPTMTRVVLMLSSPSVSLPSPQQTAFFFGTRTGRSTQFNMGLHSQKYSTTSTSSTSSVNNASITEPYPR